MYSARVLIVDDSPTMRQFIAFAMQRLPGLQLAEAGDGVAALKMMADQKFDLLLTDLKMPLMDGLRLISLLRSDPDYRQLPIVVVTAEGSPAARRNALEVGANVFFTKPLQTAELVSVVRNLLNPELH